MRDDDAIRARALAFIDGQRTDGSTAAAFWAPAVAEIRDALDSVCCVCSAGGALVRPRDTLRPPASAALQTLLPHLPVARLEAAGLYVVSGAPSSVARFGLEHLLTLCEREPDALDAFEPSAHSLLFGALRDAPTELFARVRAARVIPTTSGRRVAFDDGMVALAGGASAACLLYTSPSPRDRG